MKVGSGCKIILKSVRKKKGRKKLPPMSYRWDKFLQNEAENASLAAVFDFIGFFKAGNSKLKKLKNGCRAIKSIRDSVCILCTEEIKWDFDKCQMGNGKISVAPAEILKISKSIYLTKMVYRHKCDR